MNTNDKQRMFKSIVAKLDRQDFRFFISTMINCGLEERIFDNLTEEDYRSWATSDVDAESQAMDLGSPKEDWSNISDEFNKFSVMTRSELEACLVAESEEEFSDDEFATMTREEIIHLIEPTE